MRRKTKIIATLGPAVSSPEDIRGLMDHGMNVARLNFSHGTHEQHERWFRWVRQVSEEADKPIAVMQDIQGPKLRVGTFPGGSVTLLADAEVMLEPGEGEGDATRICVAYLGDVELEPGSSVLLADGLIALEVLSVKPGRVAARIVTGGVLRDHKGAAFPGAAMRIPAITPKDEVDLAFGMELGFDLIAASFVGRSDDLRQIRRHVGDVPIIAKIESAVGYANLDEILTEADGAMVARGDLGVEVSLERVPRMQTEILARTNASGKISITATEMLESMTLAPRPTRAEVTDVYRCRSRRHRCRHALRRDGHRRVPGAGGTGDGHHLPRGRGLP